MLQLPQLKQFAQRVSVSHHLDALSTEETYQYVRHRISVAGGDPDLFGEKACALLWFHSRGVPRVINTLCDMALVYGYASEQKTIDAELIKEVVRDRNRNATLGRPVEFRQYDPVDAGAIHEFTRLRHSVLTDGCVQDEQNLMRSTLDCARGHTTYLLELIHQVDTRMQTPRGVNEDDISAFCLC